MKKFLLLAAVALGAMSASAQALQEPGFWQNWSIGVDAGGTTRLTHQAFFGSMRGMVGLNVKKQITPTFGIGVEGQWGLHTSIWKNRIYSTKAFDSQYVGVYGTVDLMNLFNGYNCGTRKFNIEVLGGTGWGHYYQSPVGKRWIYSSNFFATKVGLNFNYNINSKLTVSLKPSILWNMNGAFRRSSFTYTSGEAHNGGYTNFNANYAQFNIQAGLTYHIGGNNFTCVKPYDQAEVDALNAQINDLRLALEACMTNSAAWEAKAAGLANELQACLNRKPEVKEVVKEIDNNAIQSVRYIFFKNGSAVVTNDQMPNVEMIAAYLKHNKEANVVIKGYASQNGNLDFNIKLAKNRAEAVRKALINKYGIKSDRIKAEGEGVGNMFKEESWNRVAICTMEE